MQDPQAEDVSARKKESWEEQMGQLRTGTDVFETSACLPEKIGLIDLSMELGATGKAVDRRAR